MNNIKDQQSTSEEASSFDIDTGLTNDVTGKYKEELLNKLLNFEDSLKKAGLATKRHYEVDQAFFSAIAHAKNVVNNVWKSKHDKS